MSADDRQPTPPTHPSQRTALEPRDVRTAAIAPSDALRARILAATKAEAAPTRAQTRVEILRTLALGFAVEIALFVGIGMVHRGPRPDWLILGTTAGTLLIAISATVLAFGRGRSMLGRPRVVLAATIAAVPAVMIAWTAAMDTSATALQLGTWSTPATIQCFELTTLFSFGPAFAFLWLRRHSDPVHPGTTAAAIGAAAGAWSTVAMSLLCPDANLPHVAVGHCLPALVVALLGAWIGVRLLSLRSAGSDPRNSPV